jgi:lipoate-protein ligase A
VTSNLWRFIPLLEAPGKVQMAIDRWLLQQHRLGKHPPTLRFYTWSPVAISLGYHQRSYPVFWHDLTWQGQPIELVRRPTGGRAVLHQGDLTYMVVTSGIPGRRTQGYERICEFLIQGWRSLGIELHYGGAGRDDLRNPNCFATSTQADLVDAAGNKLIGSAQLRQGKAILQHGSMRLAPDPALWTQVFGEPVRPLLRFQGTGNRDEQGTARVGDILQALTVAARECLAMECVLQPLSAQEWQEIVINLDGDRAQVGF